MSSYAIRGGEEGKRRLNLLAQIMAPTTDALLLRAGVGPGQRCLDLGCGGGHVTQQMARIVGPTGSIVGVDLDPVKLDAARAESRQMGLTNVEFRLASVTDWAEPTAYDVVYGRFILSHLAEREAIVCRMRDALRPGGVLILEDIDFTGAFSYPPNPAHERYCQYYRAVVRKRGGDADLGRQLYALCLDAGLDQVEVRIVHLAHVGREPGKELSLSTLVNIEDALVAEGIATSAEVADAVAALTAFTEDPRSLIGLPRVFQVWGRPHAA